ncbi:MAG: hypothetical protein ACRDZO_18985 [Egibacteraceae bacterium]
MRVRSAQPADRDAIRGLFRATVAGGRPLAFRMPGFEGYEKLCLGWYLGPGLAAAAVAVEEDHRVVGYALVCADEPAYRRWVQPRALVWAGQAYVRMAWPATSVPARRFLRLRLADGMAAWWASGAPPMPVHAHLNVSAGSRCGVASSLLVLHIDAVCARLGAAGWYGEINARQGRRVAALERLVGEVTHRAPNRTLSWVTGHPVERLTIVRRRGGPPSSSARAADHPP